MNRALRTRHRHVSTTLAVLLPLGMALALRARTEMPRMPRGDGSPSSLVLARPGGDPVEYSQSSGDGRMRCRVWPRDTAGRAICELTLEGRPLARPDVLLYWGEGEEPLDRLTGEETLVGNLSSGTTLFQLPQGVDASRGRLLLYSLAHAEVVTAMTLDEAGG